MSAPDRDSPVSGRVHAPDPGRLAEQRELAENWLSRTASGYRQPEDPSRLAEEILDEYDRRGVVVQAAEALVERWEARLDARPGSGVSVHVLLDTLAAAVRAPDRGADDPNGANDE